MNTPQRPFRFLVRTPVLQPVAARPGDVIMVRPGHAEYPVMAIRHDGRSWQYLRTGSLDPDYRAIMALDREGAIQNLEQWRPLASDPHVRAWLLAGPHPVQQLAGLNLQRARDTVDDVQVNASRHVVLEMVHNPLAGVGQLRQLDLRQAGAESVLADADAKLKGHTAQRRRAPAVAPSRDCQPRGA